MSLYPNTRIEHVRDLCRRLRPFLGEKIDNLLQAYMAEDEKGKQQIETYLELLTGKYLPLGLEDAPAPLVPPAKEAAKGEYPLATVLYGKNDLYEFGLREPEWIQHVGIFGRSGAGKTNLGFHIMTELTKRKKPVLVFDWERNYRDLLSLPEFQEKGSVHYRKKHCPIHLQPSYSTSRHEPKDMAQKAQ